MGFVLAFLRVIWCVLAVICGFRGALLHLGFLGFLCCFVVSVFLRLFVGFRYFCIWFGLGRRGFVSGVAGFLDFVVDCLFVCRVGLFCLGFLCGCVLIGGFGFCFTRGLFCIVIVLCLLWVWVF